MKSAAHWLLKTEPGTYSFDQLRMDRSTNWSGIRNFQARNNLRLMSRDDLALIYHSGDERAVVGIAKVIREAYPDPDPEKKGDWVQIEIEAVRALSRPVGLSEIKSTRALESLPLVKHTRLSTMPITAGHFETILKLSENPRRSESPEPNVKSKARK